MKDVSCETLFHEAPISSTLAGLNSTGFGAGFTRAKKPMINN